MSVYTPANAVLWDQALTALHAGLVLDINRSPDECGEPTQIEIVLPDGGDKMYISDEDGGYCYAVYDLSGDCVEEGGGPDVAEFPSELARLVRA